MKFCRSHIRRETSNKALNAINEIHLVPFLMSFLAARDKLPLATVTAAGVSLGIQFTSPLLTFLVVSTMSLCADGR